MVLILLLLVWIVLLLVIDMVDGVVLVVLKVERYVFVLDGLFVLIMFWFFRWMLLIVELVLL